MSGLHRDTLPLQGITNTGGVIRRSHQPLHWVYPQPQQQHPQRTSSGWPQSINALSIASSNINSLELHPTASCQSNMTSNTGGHHTSISSSILDSSSHILGASGPPPSIKNGGGGFNSGNTSNQCTSSDNDDEWKNIHVVRSIVFIRINNSLRFYSNITSCY